MRNNFLFRLGAIALVGVMLIATWQGFPLLLAEVFGSGSPRTVAPRGDLAADEQSTIALFENARGSVAYISTTERVVDPFTRNPLQVPRGSGSGFFWDNLGHVVTNHHVIAGAGGASVRLADGRAFEATLVGSSPDHDLAVLRIAVPTGRPAPLPIGTSAELRVGQKVFAIGNPFGLSLTMTKGIISALDREIESPGSRTISGAIQLDAPINPGNSGGPLLDKDGRLIGVNSSITTPSGGNVGIGFAIPVDTVNEVVPRLIADGKLPRPDLGVKLVDPSILFRNNIRQGAMVAEVIPGGPADQAGLKGLIMRANGTADRGDLILAVDGQPIGNNNDFLRSIAKKKIGDTVKLTIERDKKKLEVAVTVRGI
jgi:S1-C subfamily serine protease